MKNVVVVRDPKMFSSFFGSRSASSDGRFFQKSMPTLIAQRTIHTALACFSSGEEVTFHFKNTPAIEKFNSSRISVKDYSEKVKADLIVFVSKDASLAHRYPNSIVGDPTDDDKKVIAVGSVIEESLSPYTDNVRRALNDISNQYNEKPHKDALRSKYNHISATSMRELFGI